jgi:hypothetical protein
VSGNLTAEILIPIYQGRFSPAEEFAIDQTFRILGAYPITFFGPQDLDVLYYAKRYPTARFKFFASQYFESVHGYNQRLVSDFFYQTVSDTAFLLIVQPDVYVFRDDLKAWLASPYDYIGAPWPQGVELNILAGKFAQVGGKPIKAYVGNGGFSLRRRLKCYKLIEEYREIAQWFFATGSNEDLFFSLMGALSEDFILPNQIIASRFSVELLPEHYYLLNSNTLPMGTHAFTKHAPEFWRQHIPSGPD